VLRSPVAGHGVTGRRSGGRYRSTGDHRGDHHRSTGRPVLIDWSARTGDRSASIGDGPAAGAPVPEATRQHSTVTRLPVGGDLAATLAGKSPA